MRVKHTLLQIDDVIHIGNRQYRLRYINTRPRGDRAYFFQPAHIPLDPLVEDDVLVIHVNAGEDLQFDRQ